MRHKALEVGVLLATGTLLAACAAGGHSATGSGSGSGSTGARGSASPAGAVTAAYDTTVRARTAHVTLLMHVTPRSGSAAVSLQASGEVNFAARASEMTLTVPTGGTVAVRVIGTTEYLRLPQRAAALSGGRPWVKVDLASLAGTPSSGLTQNTDPMQPLSYLRNVGAVREVGHATVAGTPTTEYTAVVDLDRLAAHQSATARRSLHSYETATGRHTLPLELFLDRHGMVHQLRMSLPVPATAGSVGAVETFTDFGAPVTVSAPPASQVTDVTGRLRAALAGGLAGAA